MKEQILFCFDFQRWEYVLELATELHLIVGNK